MPIRVGAGNSRRAWSRHNNTTLGRGWSSTDPKLEDCHATVALGPLGLFAHNMVKGKDVTVTPKQTFPAWVETNSTINVQ